MQELLNVILIFFSKLSRAKPTPISQPAVEIPKKETKVEINWTDSKAKISKYFTVKEALFLPSWGCYHIPTEEEKAAIIEMANIMDMTREFLNQPINIHCWIRPTKANCPDSPYHGQNYNAYTGSKAKRSAHIFGKGVDWDCGEDCNVTRKKLLPKLEEFKVCMEDITGPWVHLDSYPPEIHGGKRFFKP